MTGKRTQSLLAILAAAILVLVPFHAVFTTWLGATFGHIDLFRVWKELLMVPLTLGAVWLAYIDKKLKQWLINSRLVLLILLYMLLHLGFGMYALHAGKVNRPALIYALLINTRFLLFFIDCLIIAAKVAWLREKWQKLILWPAVVVIVFGLLQQFVLPRNFLTHVGYGPKTIPAFQTVDQKPQYTRLQSTLRGPNPLGAYLLMVITTLAAILFFQPNRRFWSALLAGATIVLFFTYSRSAWLGTALAVVVLGYLLIKKQKQRRFGLMVLGLLLVVISLTVLVGRKNNTVENTLFHTSQTSRSPESSNAARTQAMLTGAKEVIHQPLGGGPGTAGPASFRNNHSPRLAENYFIQIGQEIGVIGLGLFIAINMSLAKRLWLEREQLLVKILLASFIGLTFVNLLSHAWADDTLAYVWWGSAGIILAPFPP